MGRAWGSETIDPTMDPRGKYPPKRVMGANGIKVVQTGMPIANRLCRWMKQSGTSIDELAEKLGVSAGRVSQLRGGSGRAHKVGIDLALRLEKATGIAAERWLLDPLRIELNEARTKAAR
jgi:plasmid maintenance system antidote protein VapI